MENEEPGVAACERYLEQCMACSWRLTPCITGHGDVAEKSCRVPDARSPMFESSQLGDLSDYNRVSRFLQGNQIGACGFDHRRDLNRTSDSALTNVVSE